MDQAIISLAYRYEGWGMGLYIAIVTLIAGLLSSFLGIEREARGQPAGLRTHVLVSVGCALLMALSVWAIGLAQGITASNWSYLRKNINYDASRIGAGIIGGIGFLCAGTIIKNGPTVRGLTTAATLWICAGIGMACGVGYILEAIITTAVTVFFLCGLSFVERKLASGSPCVHLIVAKDFLFLKRIDEVALENQLVVKSVRTKNVKFKDDVDAIDIEIRFAFLSHKENIDDFMENFSSDDAIYEIRRTTRKKRNRKE